MSDLEGSEIREVAAYFGDRASFDAAVQALQREGIPRERLSVLSTHEAIEAVQPHSRLSDLAHGLVNEAHRVGPITTAGFIGLAAGPVGAIVSGLIGAGMGAHALWDVTREVTAADHSEAFARALHHGAAVLWVRVDGANEEKLAESALSEAGGTGIHGVTRPARPHG